MFRRTALLAGLGCLLATGAFAQSAPPVRIRGTASAVTADMLTVATRAGPQVSIKLVPPVMVTALQAVPMSDIKPDGFMAIVSKPGTDDLEAVSVIYFPPGAQHPRELQVPWDLPNTTMTNAVVSGAVASGPAGDVSLTMNGRKVKLTVPPGTPVVTPIPAALSDLKPGVAVMLFATKEADGSLSASRVTVGKNEVDPTS